MRMSQEPHDPRRQLFFIVIVAGMASLAISVAAWKIFSSVSSSGRTLPTAPSISAAPPVGRRAPDFSLPLFSGGTFRLQSLKGKPVLLNFWASWCVPCREETSLLVRLHRIYGTRGIAFVGVNVEDEERAARAFVAQYHVDYPLVRSMDEAVIDAYAVPGIPTTVFIGANGVVIDKFTGGFVSPAGEKALVERLERLLGVQP
jgi:cytochrome c biogenesis protein CcmG, thiol:disulfide interchange protein DsbE